MFQFCDTYLEVPLISNSILLLFLGNLAMYKQILLEIFSEFSVRSSSTLKIGAVKKKNYIPSN